MNKFFLCFFLVISSVLYSQQNVDLSEYTMSNNSSAAFLLVDESPTIIYTADNLKALSLHVLDNFGQSISFELSPYFILNSKSPNRTYYKYIGVEKDTLTNKIKQNPFSGLNTTNVSFAYVEKEFAGIEGDRKTYSIGVNTTILRWYTKADLDRSYTNSENMAKKLSDIVVPVSILSQGADAIRVFYSKQALPFQKTFKPTFRLDGAIGYSTLLKENDTNAETANRFGSWLTGEFSLLLNYGADAKHNNYLNILFTGRYVEDEFNIGLDDEFFTEYYRDYGGKIEFEFGRVAFSYEYISRNGSITSERSVGNLTYTINEDISLTGGFGKDFPLDENLVTVFGINWGVGMGKTSVPIK